jgi:hypothetical protein
MDGKGTLAEAPGALPRLIYMGPLINWPWQGPWSLGRAHLPISPVSSPILFCLDLSWAILLKGPQGHNTVPFLMSPGGWGHNWP